jgi:hypothetical protein
MGLLTRKVMSELKLPTAEDVIASSATSYWLKNALVQAMTRDPVDAARDATLLAEVLGARADGILLDSKKDAAVSCDQVAAPDTPE